MKLLLLLPILALLGCGTVTPYGAVLNGTNASKITIEGNSKTGEYRLEAEDLNHSDSFGKATDTFRLIKQAEVAGEVTQSVVGEAGSVTEILVE